MTLTAVVCLEGVALISNEDGSVSGRHRLIGGTHYRYCRKARYEEQKALAVDRMPHEHASQEALICECVARLLRAVLLNELTIKSVLWKLLKPTYLFDPGAWYWRSV